MEDIDNFNEILDDMDLMEEFYTFELSTNIRNPIVRVL